MASTTIDELNDKGRGTLVEAFQCAVDHGYGMVKNIPGLITRVLDTGAWRRRLYGNQIYEHSSFEAFLTSEPLAGCGYTVVQVEALIRDDAEALRKFREAIKNPLGTNQYTEGTNNVRTLYGNNRSYALERLQRERPDLHKRVLAKE